MSKSEEALYIINDLSDDKLSRALSYLWALYGPTKKKEYRANEERKVEPKASKGDVSSANISSQLEGQVAETED